MRYNYLIISLHFQKNEREQFYKSINIQTKNKIRNIEENIHALARNVRVAYSIDECKYFAIL